MEVTLGRPGNKDVTSTYQSRSTSNQIKSQRIILFRRRDIRKYARVGLVSSLFYFLVLGSVDQKGETNTPGHHSESTERSKCGHPVLPARADNVSHSPPKGLPAAFKLHWCRWSLSQIRPMKVNKAFSCFEAFKAFYIYYIFFPIPLTKHPSIYISDLYQAKHGCMAITHGPEKDPWSHPQLPPHPLPSSHVGTCQAQANPITPTLRHTLAFPHPHGPTITTTLEAKAQEVNAPQRHYMPSLHGSGKQSAHKRKPFDFECR